MAAPEFEAIDYKVWMGGWISAKEAAVILAEVDRLRGEINGANSALENARNGLILEIDRAVAREAQLRGELAAEKGASGHLEAEVDRLREEVQAARSAADGLRKMNAQVRQQRNALTNEVDRLRAQVARVRESLLPHDPLCMGRYNAPGVPCDCTSGKVRAALDETEPARD